ncbi:MAG: TonB-dependent receptor [Phenylobacterium sp.]|uniref:TonB-dependent receptor domain-containing protein n=1 Tax=Phenylobacterium sp. TaxID=1871053 RepID=UPI0017D147CB|nr:TonB-dependent receptor [Phenylobacterium sp.]MBA4794876.1 TonB-dependent receptor [Phenylobacterium sp.]
MAARLRRTTAWAVAALAVTLGLAAPRPALAQAAPSASYDLPPRDLAGALVWYSLTTGQPLIVDPRLTRGRRSGRVKDARTPKAALAQLLAGTGLAPTPTPSGVLMIGPAPAAAPAAPPAPAPAPTITDLPEVVVTAERRAGLASETPMALSTFSGEGLERLGLRDMEAVAALTPGLTIAAASPASAGFSMRGITQASGDATREPRVSVFQDGVPASKERGAYFELYDLERLEVVKGPQSTLYGRSAMTGAINVIQNKADPDRPAISLRLEVGDYDWRSLEATANQPLSEVAALRLAVVSRRRDGDTPNLLGGADLQSVSTDAGRIVLSLRPAWGSADLIVNYQHDEPSGPALKSLTFAPADPETGRPLGDLDRFSPPALSAQDAQGRPRPLGLDRELFSASVGLERPIGEGLVLSSLSSFRRFAADDQQDADGMALPIVSLLEETRGAQLNQEIRLAYDAGGAWRGFLGINLFRESGTQRVPMVIDERLQLARMTGRLTAPWPASSESLLGQAVLADQLQAVASRRGYALSRTTALAIAGNLKPTHLERTQNYSDVEAFDLFADVAWRLGARWEVSAGLRFGTDAKTSAVSPAVPLGPSVLAGVIAAGTMDETRRGAFLQHLAGPEAGRWVEEWPPYGLLFQPTAGNGDKISSDLEDSGWSWRLTARYEPRAGYSLYGAYARGRRPTVLVAGAPTTPLGPARFGVAPAETVDSWELGLKARPPGRRLALDAAAYAYEYRDFQTTQIEGGQLRTVNAGEASAYGLELEATVVVAPGATAGATYAYGHARLQSGAMAGNRFRLAPDHQASLYLDLAWPAPGGELRLRPSYSWRSKFFFSDDNDRPELSRALAPDLVQDEWQDAYGRLDVRLEYRPAGGGWTLGAFVKNALDERYIQEGGFIGEALGYSASAAGPPRTMGLSLRWSR